MGRKIKRFINILVILIPILVLVVDQLTKQLITRTMELGQSNRVISNFLYITYHRNSGAAFGILQGQMLFFYVVTAIAVIAIVLWMIKLDFKKEPVLAISLALILGGALGNFIDRVLYQAVIDFIHTVWSGNSFPIFNVADIALVSGSILMAIDVLILDRRRKKELYFSVDHEVRG
jgi:signal peptidase II